MSMPEALGHRPRTTATWLGYNEIEELAATPVGCWCVAV
jgi:hypothetical protein